MASNKFLRTLTFKNKNGTTSPVYEFIDGEAREDIKILKENMETVKSKIDFEFATDDDIYALFSQEASE